MSRRTPDAAQSITSAPEPLGADQARRARRYLVQMGIRVVCFLLAALLWAHVPLWVSLTLIVGAVILPYTAVLFANAGRERQAVGPVAVLPPSLPAGPPPARPHQTFADDRTSGRADAQDGGDGHAPGRTGTPAGDERDDRTDGGPR